MPGKKHPTVLVTWGFAYLAIFMIPMILFSFVLLRSASVITSESTRANENFAKQICTSIDKNLMEISNAAQNCVRSTEVITVMEQQEYGSAAFHYDVYLAIEYLKKVAGLASGVDSVHIFLADGSTLSLASYYPAAYVDSLMRYSDFPYKEYKMRAEAFKKDQFVVMGEGKDLYLCYICVPRNYSLSGIEGQIVVTASLRSMSNMLLRSDDSNETGIMVLDDQDRMVFSNRSISQETLSSFLSASHAEENQFQDSDGSWMSFAVADSAVSTLRYVVITPRSAFLKSYLLIRNLTLICMAAAVILFALLACFLLRRNYAPLRALQTSVAGAQDEQMPLLYRSNEFMEIRNAVNRTLDENKRISHALEQQRYLVQQNLLMSLMRGRLHWTDGHTPLEFCSIHGVTLRYPRFAVLLFSIQSLSADEVEEYSFQYSILKKAVSDQLGQKYLYYTADSGGVLTVLMNFEENPAWMQETLRGELNQIYAFLDENYHISFYTAVSSAAESFDGISKAYYEASYVMDYLLLHQKKVALFYSDYLNGDAGGLYLYSGDMEQRLSYYIRLGMEERAVRQLDLIFDQTAGNSDNPPEMVNCLIFDITGTLLRLMEPQQCQGAVEIIRQLSSAVSLDSKRQILCSLIHTLCARNSSQLEQKKPKVVEDAIAYIGENYADPELNVNSLADNFHISSSYLSKLFSEQTGQRLLDYINQTRIHRARELLRQGIVVQEVAGRVGLRTSANLIRLFKKYEGITPGEYREMDHSIPENS